MHTLAETSQDRVVVCGKSFEKPCTGNCANYMYISRVIRFSLYTCTMICRVHRNWHIKASPSQFYLFVISWEVNWHLNADRNGRHISYNCTWAQFCLIFFFLRSSRLVTSGSHNHPMRLLPVPRSHEIKLWNSQINKLWRVLTVHSVHSLRCIFLGISARGTLFQ